jgi:outer membrane immunogenic protein
MKKLTLAVSILTASFVNASAADLLTKAPPPIVAPLYNWSGFYIGLNGGGGWSHKCWDLNTPAGAFQADIGCHDATGGLAGGQVGYRWRAGSWVFGLEGQGDWADLTGSNPSLLTPRVTDQSKITALGLFTGQVGYAWNNVLWYVKGGGAVVNDKYTGIGAIVGPFDQASETRWGGAVGTGLEFGFASNWSVAVEYDHAFLGSRSLNFLSTGALIPAGTFSRNVTVRQDLDMITARVSYHFSGPVVANY